MYSTTDQSSYSSNPSTPVNSPPPLTSQAQQPAPHQIHSSTAPPGPTWQPLTPVLNGGTGPGSAGINGMSNGTYTPDLVSRGIHMVSYFS